MRAVVIRRHGGPEVIEVAEVDDPRPAPGEVLVRVRAASLNHLDLWVAKGGRAKLAFPHVLGSDVFGEVEEVGEEVTGWKKGDAVVANPGVWCGACARCEAGEHSECSSYTILGLGRPGTYAEFVAVPARSLARPPRHLSEVEAATMGIAPLTAYRMLFSRARLVPAERVLVHGIGGGVATFALLFAKAAGCEVAVTSSSDDKLDRARELGADCTVRYDKGDPARSLGAAGPFDVAFDTAGAATLPLSLAALRKGGRIVTCGVTSGAKAEVSLQALYWNSLSLLGSTMGSQGDFEAMLAFVEEKAIRPVLDKVFPLDQAPAAARRMHDGAQFGKIVLTR